MMLSGSGYLIDSNVWIALAFPTHLLHQAALAAYLNCSPDKPAILCRATQLSFLRLATTPAICEAYGGVANTNHDAWVALSNFSAQPVVTYREEPLNVTPIWQSLATRSSQSPKIWMDAYLAAFAICGGYQLVTLDQGFKQYKRLDLILLSGS